MMHGGFGGGGYRRGTGGRLGLDREEYEDGRVYNHRVVTRLFSYILPHRARLMLTLAAIIVYTATVVTLPWMIAKIIDDYVREGDLSGLNVVVPIFVGVALLQYGSQYVHLRTMAFVGQKVLYALRVGLFRHLQRLSMSFYNRNEVGRVMSRVQNDVSQLQEFLSIVVITIADVLSLAGIITAMTLMNARLAAVTLSVIPALFVVMLVWQRYARRAFMRARRAISEVNANLQENISGVRVVQSMNRENANIRSFGSANSENLGANLEAVRMQAILFPSVEFPVRGRPGARDRVRRLPRAGRRNRSRRAGRLRALYSAILRASAEPHHAVRVASARYGVGSAYLRADGRGAGGG